VNALPMAQPEESLTDLASIQYLIDFAADFNTKITQCTAGAVISQ
jgi:hypothetical protein